MVDMGSGGAGKKQVATSGILGCSAMTPDDLAGRSPGQCRGLLLLIPLLRDNCGRAEKRCDEQDESDTDNEHGSLVTVLEDATSDEREKRDPQPKISDRVANFSGPNELCFRRQVATCWKRQGYVDFSARQHRAFDAAYPPCAAVIARVGVTPCVDHLDAPLRSSPHPRSHRADDSSRAKMN
jgi:hypothetical protein